MQAKRTKMGKRRLGSLQTVFGEQNNRAHDMSILVGYIKQIMTHLIFISELYSASSVLLNSQISVVKIERGKRQTSVTLCSV
jgi:hypothetical protein